MPRYMVITALVLGVLAGILVFAVAEFDNPSLTDEEVERSVAGTAEEPNILLRSPVLTGAGVTVAVLGVGLLLIIASNIESERREDRE